MSAPIPLRKVAGWDELFADEQPGAFFWTTIAGTRRLVFTVPAQNSTGWVHTAVPVEGPHAWGWDGNEERPTLTPSVRISADRELWHGFVRDGMLVTA